MSRIAASGLLALTLVVVAAMPASAQTCRALPAIGENSKGNIGADLAFMNNQFGFDGHFTYGTQFAFGGIQYGKSNYTQYAYTSTIFGFHLGGQVDLGKEKRFSACPIFMFQDESAGNLNASGLAETIDSSVGGAAFGFVLVNGDRRQITPMLELSAGRVRDTLAIPGTKAVDTATIGVVTVGVGFGFDKRFSLRPAVHHQIGGVNATPDTPFAAISHNSFTITAVFAYGHR